LLSGSSDGQVSLLTLSQDNWNVTHFPAHKSGVTCVSWGPARFILEENNEERKITGFSPMKFATGGCDSLVKMWEYNNVEGKFVDKSVANYSGWIKDLSFAQNNEEWLSLTNRYEVENPETLAICAENKTVAILVNKNEKWEECKIGEQSGQAVKISWNQNGHSFAVIYEDGKSIIYEETAAGQWAIMPSNSEDTTQNSNE
jgi:protein transport protein SEC13